jgi:flagellar protein FlaF
LDAAGRLQAIRDGWDDRRAGLQAALTNNRQLWSILATSATSSENPLPLKVRENVANLGIFVFKQTMAMLADPKPEKLDSLIGINRELAAGLIGRGARPTKNQSAS